MLSHVSNASQRPHWGVADRFRGALTMVTVKHGGGTPFEAKADLAVVPSARRPVAASRQVYVWPGSNPVSAKVLGVVGKSASFANAAVSSCWSRV